MCPHHMLLTHYKILILPPALLSGFHTSSPIITERLANESGHSPALAQSAIALILPGYTVLCGALELQAKSIIAGSVRLVYAIIYSLFLGFALTMGTAIYGVIDKEATSETVCREPLSGEGYWIFFFVPAFAFCLMVINQAKYRQMPVMLGKSLQFTSVFPRRIRTCFTSLQFDVSRRLTKPHRTPYPTTKCLSMTTRLTLLNSHRLRWLPSQLLYRQTLRWQRTSVFRGRILCNSRYGERLLPCQSRRGDQRSQPTLQESDRQDCIALHSGGLESDAQYAGICCSDTYWMANDTLSPPTLWCCTTWYKRLKPGKEATSRVPCYLLTRCIGYASRHIRTSTLRSLRVRIAGSGHQHQ